MATGDTGPVLVGGCSHRKRDSGWPQWGHKHSPLCPVPQRTTDAHPQQPPSSRLTAWTSPPRKCPLWGHPAVPGRAPRSTLGSVGLPSSAEAAGLRSRARQLAAQNTKLQRDAEQAEELNTRLAEEIAQLQAQLRRCPRGAPGHGVWVSTLGMLKRCLPPAAAGRRWSRPGWPSRSWTT